MRSGNRRAKRAGRARRVKAARLVGVSGRPPDPNHHLVAGNKGRDQRLAIAAALLGYR